MFSNRFLFIRVFVTLTFSATISLSQNKAIDSMANILKTAKEDTNKANILYDLSWEYNAIDFQKAEEYAQRLIELSRKIKYKKGEGNGYASLGASRYFQSKYPDAINFYEKSLELRKSANDKTGTGGAFNNVAMVYHKQGNYTSAINYYLEALKIFESLGETEKAAKTIQNIGVLYLELKNYQLSLKYGFKALAQWQKLNDNNQISISYNNIGNSYSGMKNYKEAINCYHKALDIEKENRNNLTIGSVYFNLGSVYIDMKAYEKSADYIRKSISLCEDSEDKADLALGYSTLGFLYFETGKTAMAIEQYKKAAKVAESIGSKNNCRLAYHGLKNAYVTQKNYAEALKYSDLYDLIKDTLFSETSGKQIAEMQTKYETEKKEKENAILISANKISLLELNRQKIQRNAIIIVFGFILFSGLILYNRYRLKNKNKILEEKNLRNIAVFKAQEDEKARLSKELHDGVGPLLSLIKLNASSIEVNSGTKKVIDEIKELATEGIKEVRNISHALMPSLLEKKGLEPALEEFFEQINQSGVLKIEFSYKISSIVFPHIQLNLYRIIQEAITNTLKYAQAKNASVQLTEKNNRIELIIHDNGIGFDIDKTGSGNGINNIYSRVDFLKGTLEKNTVKANGTKFKILIPSN